MISQLDEKIILVSLVGILKSLKENCILIDEAEKYLFSPYMLTKLKKESCNEQILNIIERGCELEDIQSLLPEKLNSNIDILLQESLTLLKGYEKFVQDFWINDK